MAKVTDFGIARSLDEEGLTADGRVLGTTDYVSPEQALGHAVNGQSDIYSLGIVLYEMLVGDVPFHGENQVAVAMKHVREDVPDIVRLRPEVTAGLAAVLDRMTCKSLEQRYPDAVALEDDLEDALAHEAARRGRATGEATAVLRTLPAEHSRGLPLLLRWRRPLLGMLAVAAVLAAVLALVLLDTGNPVQRGTGAPRAKAPAGTQAVSVGRGSPHDYDPEGGDGEHPERTQLAVDGDRDTTWTTEHYSGGTMSKDGVGLYIDAKPSVKATAILIQTPEPGWKATIYGAPPGAVPEGIDGWTPLGGGTVEHKKQTFPLDTSGETYRYYLVWITALPPDADAVEIGEATLFKST
jgi:serine/threonine-protein kinase